MVALSGCAYGVVDGRDGDGGRPDAGLGDDAGVSTRDASESDGGILPGLDAGVEVDAGPRPLCANGQGESIFRFHFASASGADPQIDVWRASCAYSSESDSECTITSTGAPTALNPEGILLDADDALAVRYSVVGLSFSRATIYIRARSDSALSTTGIRVESPIWGDTTVSPIANGPDYQWYSVDWTGYLTPGDDPSVTAMWIRAWMGSQALAIQSVELCVN